MKPTEHQKALLYGLVAIGQHREEQRKRQLHAARSTRGRLEQTRLAWLEKSIRGREIARRRKEELKRHAALRRWFEFIDKDGGGSLDAEELEEPLISAGLAFSREEVVRLIKEVDDDGSGEVEFGEFLQIVENQGSKAREGGKEKQDGPGSELPSDNPIQELVARLDSGKFGDPEQLDLATRLTTHRRRLIMEGMLAQLRGQAGGGAGGEEDSSPREQGYNDFSRYLAAKTVDAIDRYARWQRSKLQNDREAARQRGERRLRRKLRRLGVRNPRTVDPAEYRRFVTREALASLGHEAEQAGQARGTAAAANLPADGTARKEPMHSSSDTGLRLKTAADRMAVDVYDDPATDAEMLREQKRDDRRRAIAAAQRNRAWAHARHRLTALAKEVVRDRNAEDARALRKRRVLADAQPGETSVRHAPESAMLATGRPTRTRDQAPEGPRARVDQYVLRKAVEAAKRAKLQAASARPLSSMVSTLGAQDKAGRTAADLPNSGSARPPWEEGAPMESPAHALPQPGPVPHSPTPSPGLGPRLLDEVQQARELLPSYFAKSLLRRRDTAGPVPRVPGEIMAVAGPGMDPNTGGGRGRGSGRAEAAPSTPSSSSSREPLYRHTGAGEWLETGHAAGRSTFRSELTGVQVDLTYDGSEENTNGSAGSWSGTQRAGAAGQTFGSSGGPSTSQPGTPAPIGTSSRSAPDGPHLQLRSVPTGRSALEGSIRASLRRVPIARAVALLGADSALGRSLAEARAASLRESSGGVVHSHTSSPAPLAPAGSGSGRSSTKAHRTAPASCKEPARRARRGPLRGRLSLAARRGQHVVS